MSIIDTHYDVIVAGGGIAGTMAAIAAAREGAHTLLVERYTALGGMGSLGLVQPITTWGIRGEYNCAGTGRQMLEQLAEDSPPGATAMSTYGPCCDAEALKWTLERRVVDAGVTLLYHTWIQGLEKDDSGRVSALKAFSKQGAFRLQADVFIDGTGDADVAAAAGIPFDVGSQGVTLMFLVAGIDPDRRPPQRDIVARYAEHKVGYRGLALFWHPRPDAAYFNVTEVENVNVLDAEGLTYATVECRRQAWEILDIVRTHIPGFERAYIAETASALGVRESRRIRGQYTLDVSDATSGREFEDVIARASCPVDVHGSDDGGKGEYYGLKQSYGIPYRCLVAAEAPNVIVTGRPISADHAAHSSLRRMAPGFALGEAAGIAAAMAAAEGGSVLDIPVRELQGTLRSYGAILDPEAQGSA